MALVYTLARQFLNLSKNVTVHDYSIRVIDCSIRVSRSCKHCPTFNTRGWLFQPPDPLPMGLSYSLEAYHGIIEGQLNWYGGQAFTKTSKI